ncbi:hypothetical protein Bbelb_067280 [Branchiostoma belcheri]|nr:hypothetical protein Bbelb_067280 [Branchiostoma belcheri]
MRTHPPSVGKNILVRSLEYFGVVPSVIWALEGDDVVFTYEHSYAGPYHWYTPTERRHIYPDRDGHKRVLAYVSVEDSGIYTAAFDRGLTSIRTEWLLCVIPRPNTKPQASSTEHFPTSANCTDPTSKPPDSSKTTTIKLSAMLPVGFLLITIIFCVKLRQKKRPARQEKSNIHTARATSHMTLTPLSISIPTLTCSIAERLDNTTDSLAPRALNKFPVDCKTGKVATHCTYESATPLRNSQQNDGPTRDVVAGTERLNNTTDSLAPRALNKFPVDCKTGKVATHSMYESATPLRNGQQNDGPTPDVVVGTDRLNNTTDSLAPRALNKFPVDCKTGKVATHSMYESATPLRNGQQNDGPTRDVVAGSVDAYPIRTEPPQSTSSGKEADDITAYGVAVANPLYIEAD